MAIGTALALGVGAASLVSGIFGSRRAARRQKRLLADQKARNEAWYARNYYSDTLNSVGAQNAMKRVRDWWSKEARQARARQAISGGTPEQAAAVAEAGSEAMADTMGNLAAQGEAQKRAADAQKLQMDAEVAAQESAIEEARQQAGANLIENGANLAMAGLSSMPESYKPSVAMEKVLATKPQMAGIPGEVPTRELPKKIFPKIKPQY